MVIMTPTPPKTAPPPVERIGRDSAERLPTAEASGRLHWLNREFVLVLPAGPRVVTSILNIFVFSVFVALWAAFGAALLFNQDALHTTWTALRDLPMVLQVVVWILFLPVTLGLWIWQTDWALWLRVLLIIGLAGGSLATLAPKPGEKSK